MSPRGKHIHNNINKSSKRNRPNNSTLSIDTPSYKREIKHSNKNGLSPNIYDILDSYPDEDVSDSEPEDIRVGAKLNLVVKKIKLTFLSTKLKTLMRIPETWRPRLARYETT